MKKPKKCVYCGVRYADTRDHIPPKGFFADPLPSNLLTVPCCTPCQETVVDSKVDETVRNVISSMANEHPAVKKDIAERRNRSFDRGTGFNREYFKEITIMFQPVTDSGIYLPKQLGLDLDEPRLDAFFNRMTRALHYKETKNIAVNIKTEWINYGYPQHQKKEEILDILERATGNVKKVGTFNEFIYARFKHPESKRYFWTMWFYEKFLVFTWMKPSKAGV